MRLLLGRLLIYSILNIWGLKETRMKEILEEGIAKKMKSEFPEIDTRFLMMLVRVVHFQHAVPALFDQYFVKMGLSKARFMVLIQLFVRGGMAGLGISDIISLYNVSSATMTGVVDTLEKEGFVERSHSKSDRRRINLRLTARGREFMTYFIPIHYANMKRLMEDFTVEDLQVFMQLNDRLVTAIEDFLESDRLRIPRVTQRR